MSPPSLAWQSIFLSVLAPIACFAAGIFTLSLSGGNLLVHGTTFQVLLLAAAGFVAGIFIFGHRAFMVRNEN